MLTKGALFSSPGVKTVSRGTYRVKQGQGPRSLTPGRFLGPRGGWVLTYAPGRADRWPRTRQPGTRATDRGPGSAALVFVNLGPGSQTPADQEHKHKHRHQAAAARPGSHRQQHQAPGTSCATSSAGSHRHQARGPRTRQRSAATRQRGQQQITAAAALTWQQITARAAVIGQQITANQAARPTAQAATGSSCATQTRQQLRTIRAPRFTRRAARATGQAQAASSAVG